MNATGKALLVIWALTIVFLGRRRAGEFRSTDPNTDAASPPSPDPRGGDFAASPFLSERDHRRERYPAGRHQGQRRRSPRPRPSSPLGSTVRTESFGPRAPTRVSRMRRALRGVRPVVIALGVGVLVGVAATVMGYEYDHDEGAVLAGVVVGPVAGGFLLRTWWWCLGGILAPITMVYLWPYGAPQPLVTNERVDPWVGLVVPVVLAGIGTGAGKWFWHRFLARNLRYRRLLDYFSFARFYALGLFALTIILIGIPLYALVDNIEGDVRQGVEVQKNPVTIKAPNEPESPSVALTPLNGRPPSDLSITFLAKRLVVDRTLLEAEIRIQVPRELLFLIVDRGSGEPAVTLDEDGVSLRAKPEYQNTVLNLLVYDDDEFLVDSASIPLAEVLDPEGYWLSAGGASYRCGSCSSFSAPIELPVATRAQSYPSDWYWLRGALIEVEVPPPLGLATPGAEPRGETTRLPLTDADVFVATGVGMAGKTATFHGGLWRSRNFYPSSNSAEWLPYFGVEINRDRATIMLSYAVALMPLAFGVILFHLSFLSGARRLSPSFSLEVAAAMLAVLPLRQVLVPAEISGLTMVDFLLGVELSVIVGLAVVRYGALLWRSPAPTASEERAGFAAPHAPRSPRGE